MIRITIRLSEDSRYYQVHQSQAVNLVL